MVTIRPTRAGKEYLNNQSEQSEKVLLSQCGGNEDSKVAKLMKSAIKLLEKTQNEKNSTETKDFDEVSFLITNKLAIVVETPNVSGNHLSAVHNTQPVADFKEAPIQNALAHADNSEQLGETPEVLPTHLGGIELESAEESETETQTQESETEN
jgi:hypothetical protein